MLARVTRRHSPLQHDQFAAPVSVQVGPGQILDRRRGGRTTPDHLEASATPAQQVGLRTQRAAFIGLPEQQHKLDPPVVVGVAGQHSGETPGRALIAPDHRGVARWTVAQGDHACRVELGPQGAAIAAQVGSDPEGMRGQRQVGGHGHRLAGGPVPAPRCCAGLRWRWRLRAWCRR